MRHSSIAKRLRRSFFFMLVLSLLFITAGVSLVRGASGSAGFGMSASRFHGEANRDAELILELNRMINSETGLPTDAASWSRLERLFPNRAFLIIGDARVVYKSRELDSKITALFPHNADFEPIVGPNQGRMPSIIFRWNTALSDGARGELFVFSVKEEPFWATAFGRLVIIILGFILLIGINGFMTWSILYHLLVPLRTLEASALRIRDGDLSRENIPRFDREFHAVFEAFDRMRQTLKESLERREKDNESRKELVASISHDLRTPIAAIKGYAEGLRDGVASTEEKRKLYIDTILSKSAHMDRLIDNLFLLSRLELKDELFEYSIIDLAPFLHDCVDEQRFDYPGLSISLHAEEGIHVRADQFQLRRVIINLIQNAYRHNKREEKTLTIKLHRKDGKALIEFHDNGFGFSDEDLARVFERFYRADKSRNGGTGLGLSISKMVMEAMGGDIEAKNGDPSGALLIIRIPIEKES